MGLARAGCQRLSVIPTDWHQLALPVSHPSKSWSLTEPSARGQRVRRLEEEEEGGGQVEMKEKGRWRGQGRILGSQVANLPDLAVAASFDGWQDYIEIGLAGWQFRELAVAGRIVILTPVAGMVEWEFRWLAVSGQQFLAVSMAATTSSGRNRAICPRQLSAPSSSSARTRHWHCCHTGTWCTV